MTEQDHPERGEGSGAGVPGRGTPAFGATGEASGPASALLGTWRAEDPASAFLEFHAPGTDGTRRMTGSDGCNGVHGEYTLEGSTATIRRGLSTLKACLGVDAWLAGAVAVTLDGDVLRVFDRQGREIGTLTRER
ncbi:META domain-containing protein [Brevibacterium album]|uniref:META domain-containing protein n=1 Tax=Brevibacterium album TaxID=417948 RepID=UPI0012EC2073|nr:META domain-containing protein [Brevibacterium album]